MILGFKEQFKAPILAGTKIHTIRADEHNRWKAGTSIQMATGVRTKHYQCFKEDVCKGIQTIRITCDEDGITQVFIDGRELPGTRHEIFQLLAHYDGFASIMDFLNFFAQLMGGRRYDFVKCDFNGKIIHWTDFKYII